MLYEIENTHSIISALKNTKRQCVKLYITKNNLKQIDFDINIPVIISNETYLLTREIYINTNLTNMMEKYDRLIILDSLQNPQNIGSIIRSAAVFNFGVLIRNRECGINETVVKCAAGGADIIDICSFNNLTETVKKLQNNEFWICGLLDKKQSNYIDLCDLKTYKKICIVIGSEESGMTALMTNLCDLTHTISGYDRDNNTFSVLNASHTASILMYSLRNYI